MNKEIMVCISFTNYLNFSIFDNFDHTMQYKSPISLLSAFAKETDNIKEIDMNALRKQILAEFELTGKPTIKTKVGELSKNDILITFENLKSEGILEHHFTLSKFPELKSLLEKNVPNGKLSFSDPVFKDGDFVRFLSPYLAYSAGIFFANCIHNPKLPINFTARVVFPILEEHNYLIIKPVYKAIDEIILKIENIKTFFSIKAIIPDATIYFSNDLIRVFNLLPRFYFAAAIDSYARSGIDFIRSFANSRPQAQRYIPKIEFIFKQLQKLVVSPDIKNILEIINKHMFTSSARESSSSKGSVRQVIMIIFLIMTLLRFCIGIIG